MRFFFGFHNSFKYYSYCMTKRLWTQYYCKWNYCIQDYCIQDYCKKITASNATEFLATAAHEIFIVNLVTFHKMRILLVFTIHSNSDINDDIIPIFSFFENTNNILNYFLNNFYDFFFILKFLHLPQNSQWLTWLSISAICFSQLLF